MSGIAQAHRPPRASNNLTSHRPRTPPHGCVPRSIAIAEIPGNHLRPVDNAPFNVIACHILSIERSQSLPIEICASLLVHDGLEVAAADCFSLEQHGGSCYECGFL